MGDHLGLFPIAYLRRFRTAPGASRSNTDLAVAVATAERYLLGFPHRLPDDPARTFSRTGGDPREPPSPPGQATFLWSDDQFMGLTLLTRLAAGDELGPAERRRFIDTAAAMQLTFTRYLRDPADGLYAHGANAATGHRSCCKWGRANGWGMLSHVEVLLALEQFPGHPLQPAVLSDYRARCAAMVAVQDSRTGMWRQLLNESDTYLETSVSAMNIVSLTHGVLQGWLPKAPYAGAVLRAWPSVAGTVGPDGVISGVCMGTGIFPNKTGYAERGTAWADSTPGGAAIVLRAAVAVQRLTAWLDDPGP